MFSLHVDFANVNLNISFTAWHVLGYFICFIDTDGSIVINNNTFNNSDNDTEGDKDEHEDLTRRFTIIIQREESGIPGQE